MVRPGFAKFSSVLAVHDSRVWVKGEDSAGVFLPRATFLEIDHLQRQASRCDTLHRNIRRFARFG